MLQAPESTLSGKPLQQRARCQGQREAFANDVRKTIGVVRLAVYFTLLNVKFVSPQFES